MSKKFPIKIHSKIEYLKQADSKIKKGTNFIKITNKFYKNVWGFNKNHGNLYKIRTKNNQIGLEISKHDLDLNKTLFQIKAEKNI